jgi:hypothetical protein
MTNVISLADVKRKQIIAQYIAYYGILHDNTRKATE